MISIDIMGGLGNQLFMIFTTLAYGFRENMKVVYPYHCNMPHRHTYWHSFLKEITVFTTENPNNQMSDYQVYSLQRYFEPRFNYNPLPIMTNVLFHGYFQSPKYFDEFKQPIFNIINLFDKQKNIKEKFYELFQNSEQIVSMHFRLGDYKEKRFHHLIMNYEYYETALKYIVEKTSSISRVLYCCESEDNEYVGEQISKLQNQYPNIQFSKVPDSTEDYEQMLIMSCCNHNIIANSSFSWWGGYFNQFQEKIVCYPSEWFGEGYNNYDHSDMIPEGWIKIQANPKHHTEPL